MNTKSVKDSITIKKLSVADASLLSSVAIKAYSDHYLHLWYDGGQWYIDKCFTPQQLEAELQDANAAFYLAYLSNEPAGFLKINIDAPYPGEDEVDALELERIYLNKEATGKGIGKELAELTFSIAKQKNKKLVWLKAMDTSEDSIAFYKKMGFKITGSYTLPHERMQESLRGMVIMKKYL